MLSYGLGKLFHREVSVVFSWQSLVRRIIGFGAFDSICRCAYRYGKKSEISAWFVNVFTDVLDF